MKGRYTLEQGLIKNIAYETGLHPKQVETIIRSQFKLVRDTFQADEYDSVRLEGFGIFKMSKARKEQLNRRKNGKTLDSNA